VQEAREIGLNFAGQERVERYVENHLRVLESSRVCYQHDDYHPGNLVVYREQFAGVIDFNRSDWGDPIEDFYKVPWFSVAASIPFARGQISGYLSASGMEDFWLRYNLFVAMNLHGSLVWEHQNSPPERQSRWQIQIEEMLKAHDLENSGPPRWFGT